MIRFFRNIRQNLLSKGSFSKYLLYALGEIILVVVGILLALQIDNWNSKKKDRETERIYLNSLRTEFESNLSELQKTMGENEFLIESLDNLLVLFDPNSLNQLNEKEVATFLNPLGKEVVFFPSKGVTTDIISSGNLKLIQNNTLRQKLASFDNALRRVENQEKVALDLRSNLMQITSRTGSFHIMFSHLDGEYENKSTFRPNSNKLLFSNLELENNLELYKRVTLTTNGYFYTSLQKDLKEILSLLEKELNKKDVTFL